MASELAIPYVHLGVFIKMRWFNKQSRLIQILLLLIPFVNLVTEVVVRVTAIAEKPTLGNILGIVLALVTGGLWGWVDLIWVILFNHLCLAD
jgi:hypothetical protein